MNKMRNNKSSIAFAAASAFLVACLFSSCSSSDGAEKDKEAKQHHADSAAAPIPTFVLEKGRLATTYYTPGELVAYQQVDLYAKENSFVKKLYADIGSEVREGQLLATLEAPELSSQLANAQSKVKSQEAIYIASKANYDRIVETSKTPGTISQNDIDQADARQKSDYAQLDAAKSAHDEIAETLKYLEVRAPFNGVISARNVNPGAYVGPSGKGSDLPMFTLQEQKHMRLVVSVPEAFTGYLNEGGVVNFSVKALPNQVFKAQVRRLAGALDNHLRAERVEMDVYSNDKKLLPGMVAEVNIPLPAQDSTFVVPQTAVVNSTERVFVIRVIDHKAQWVYGTLNPGDLLIRSASEEKRDGSPIQ
jgi:RND family efflux transporter MFP subunit